MSLMLAGTPSETDGTVLGNIDVWGFTLRYSPFFITSFILPLFFGYWIVQGISKDGTITACIKFSKAFFFVGTLGGIGAIYLHAI